MAALIKTHKLAVLLCDDTRGVSGVGSTFYCFNIILYFIIMWRSFHSAKGIFLLAFYCDYEQGDDRVLVASVCLFNHKKLYLLIKKKKKIKYLICFLVLQLQSESMKHQMIEKEKTL